MLLMDHWAGLSWLDNNLFAKSIQFLITSGGMLSGPDALFNDILFLALRYSSIANSPVLKSRLWNTVFRR